VRPEGIAKIRQWLLVEGNAFHERARREISKYDQDITPDPKFSAKGTRVVLSSFGKAFEDGDKE
jgi:hypothetical protein